MTYVTNYGVHNEDFSEYVAIIKWPNDVQLPPQQYLNVPLYFISCCCHARPLGHILSRFHVTVRYVTLPRDCEIAHPHN